MTTCMDCTHWSPESTSESMTRLGHAACTQRPTPGLTIGAHARVCLRYVPAEADTAAARHEKWDYQSKQGVLIEKVIYRLPSTRLGHQLVSQGWGWAKEQILQERPVIVEFRLETRTDAQNRLLHALFGDAAKQAQWGGKARRPEQWKTLFVSGHAVATQQEIEIVPGLEGEFLNIRESTARMGKRRMASLLEYVMAWCAQNNVELREARQWLNEGRWA